MTRLAVLPIVEGHGEEKSAIRTLLTRIWTELLGEEYMQVLRPIRRPRAHLVRTRELLRAVDLAELKLREVTLADKKLVLILFDADEDLPCRLAPELLAEVQRERSHLDIAVVLANPEFETWFAASAHALTNVFDLSMAAPAADPEQARQKKGAIQRWMHGEYSETLDQPRLTAMIDLAMCRSRSKSFDKLCRVLEARR